jgi:hypothetical protein
VIYPPAVTLASTFSVVKIVADPPAVTLTLASD